MRIIAISDPHLGNLEKMVNKFHYPPNYFEQVAQNVAAERADLLLIAGDLIWAEEYTDAFPELHHLQNLQAKTICFIEGNHDLWVLPYSQMYNLYNSPNFYFTSGRSLIFENIGICGIRGSEQGAPYITRELHLLQKALQELVRAEIEIAICLIHYPPTSLIFKNPEDSFAEDHYFALMEEYGINKVVYGHIHADHQLPINLYMKIDEVELYCTSIDYFNWQPVQIL
ncbi:MAG: metallophosphoesterase [Candidatus Helarchaeota archaeon]